jgi:arylsulfatase A-like enzyme
VGYAGAAPVSGHQTGCGTSGRNTNAVGDLLAEKIKHDGKVRSQFHHVNDIAATIYDILDITPPKVVNGVEQQPLDGTSMVYTFDNP